jgi:hypothetical protein
LFWAGTLGVPMANAKVRNAMDDVENAWRTVEPSSHLDALMRGLGAGCARGDFVARRTTDPSVRHPQRVWELGWKRAASAAALFIR